MAKSARAELVIAADDRTKAAFDKVENRMRVMGAQAKRAAFAVGAVTAAMAAGTAKAISHADSIAKTAKAAGINARAYQELSFAASQAGVEQGQLDSALVRFTKRLGLADQGTGAAAKAYKELGIETRTASGEMRGSEDVIREVADRISQMGSESERTARTTQFFGDDAARLRLLLENGSGALDDYAAQAQKLGIVLDTDLLRKAEAASDQLDIMGRIATAQGTVLASSLFPAVVGVGNAFAEAAPKIRQFMEMLNEDSETRLFGKLSMVEDKIKDLQLIAANPSAEGVDFSDNPFIREIQQKLFGGDPEEIEKELVALQGVAESLRAKIKEQRQASLIDESGLAGSAMELPEGEGGAIPGIGDPDENVERTRQMFERIHEQRLMAEQRSIELEQLRKEQQIQKLEAERTRLEEHGLLTQDIEAQFREARENAEATSEARITEIRQREAKRQSETEDKLANARAAAAQRGKSAVVNALTTLADQSKAAQVAMLAFEKGKAIADIVVLTQVAAARALAELGPILGPPAAAAIKAAGAASVGLVAAQGIAQAQGGGGSSGGGGGIGGSAPVGGGNDSRPPPSLPNPAENVRERDQNAAATVVEFVFRGDGSSLSEAFSEELRRSIRDGDAVVIPGDSRQAMEIRGD